MAPLKSMEREHPIIDLDFQNFCAAHGIFSESRPCFIPIKTRLAEIGFHNLNPVFSLSLTLATVWLLRKFVRKILMRSAVEDFVLHDLYELAAFAEQQPTSERLKEGITQVLTIMDNLHQPWLNGMELLEDALQNKQFLSTGSEGVDLLLRGGLREGQLTELVGQSSSGKTQFCLQTAANVALKHMGSVVYIDTGNSFSPHRIAHFVQRISDSAFNQYKQKSIQKAMSNIACHSVFDIFVLFDVLHQLEFDLRSQMDRRDYRVRLLIVDSISSLITPVLGGSGSQGHALMISAGFLLKKLSHEHSIVVLVTNHTVAGEGGITKPALGESWKSVPHVRLLLSRNHESNICRMSILKHPAMASGKVADFLIEL